MNKQELNLDYGMKIISEHKLAELIKAKWKLSLLEEAGVESWIFYDSAMNKNPESKAYKDLLKMSDKEITKHYFNA